VVAEGKKKSIIDAKNKSKQIKIWGSEK